jgi:hypothetical protein
LSAEEKAVISMMKSAKNQLQPFRLIKIHLGVHLSLSCDKFCPERTPGMMISIFSIFLETSRRFPPSLQRKME